MSIASPSSPSKVRLTRSDGRRARARAELTAVLSQAAPIAPFTDDDVRALWESSVEGLPPGLENQGDRVVEGRFQRSVAESSRAPARTRRSSRLEVAATVLVDLTALVAATFAGLLLLAAVAGNTANSMANFGQNLRDDMVFPLVTLAMFAVYSLYRQRRRRFRPRGFHDVGRFFHSVVAGSLATVGVGVVLHRFAGHPQIAPAQLLSIALATLVLVPLGRGACHVALRHHPRVRTRVLIVGSGVVAEQIRQHCAHDPGVEVVGMVDDDPAEGSVVLGSIDQILPICARFGIDRLLVTFSRAHPSDTVDKLRALQGSVPISIVPRYFELMSYRSQVDEIDGLPMIDVAPSLLGWGPRFVKRSIDIVVSAMGLFVLLPVLAVACVTIKFSSPGPVLFGQNRIGRGGRPFMIWKLRSMRVDAERERDSLAAHNIADGPMFKAQQDPRSFRFGTFIRRTSIDEIPQLFNVLRGQMSLVGPRPFIPEEAEAFGGWAARRFEVRPGLTGLWQVSGRSDLSHDQLQRLDYLYVASWSIFWDLRILWKTPATVLGGRGAY